MTGGSIDNMKLIGAGNADVAFTQVDTAVDAINGNDKFPKKLPIKALVVMYVNLMSLIRLPASKPQTPPPRWFSRSGCR